MDFYERKLENLPKDAAEYLQLLDALDLLGLAYKRKAVDRGVVREYIRSLLLSPDTLNRQIFDGIRKRTGVTNVYEHLEYLVESFERRNTFAWIKSQGRFVRALLRRENLPRNATSSPSAAGAEACTATSPKDQIVAVSLEGASVAPMAASRTPSEEHS